MADDGAPRGWVLYDGACGVCARWVPYWAPTLARLGLGTAPLQAPSPRRPFLTAEWRHLVMLNYEVDPEILTPLVPVGTTLDLCRGRALVSVVGFRFYGTRLFGAAIPGHRDFDEVNLRFYVRRELPAGETRHGVVFVRELVSRLAVALVARLAYNEPYRALRMRSVTPREETEVPGRIAYEWQIGGVWEGLAATTLGPPAVPDPGSEAAFITQHHWGYTRQRDGSTVEYEVEHPSWRTWAAGEATLAMDVARLYGVAFVTALARGPVSALVADGSAVRVYPPHRLEGGRTAAARAGAS